MPKEFAAALETALEPEADVETTDVADTDTGETTETADTSVDASAETTDDNADTTTDDKSEDETDADTGGSWFGQPKPDAKKQDAKADAAAGADGKKQKAMPETVRQKIATEERAKVDAEQPWRQGWSNEEGAQVRSLWDMGKRDVTELAGYVLTAAIQRAINDPIAANNLKLRLEHLGLVPKGTADTKADEDPMPNVTDYRAAEGLTNEGLQKYNADMSAWSNRQVMKEVDKRMAPLVGDRQTAQRQAQNEAQATAYGERAFGLVSQRPGFRENIKAIQDAYGKIPRPWQNAAGHGDMNHPQYREERELLLEAYYSVMQNKAQADAKKQLAADLKKKQDVGTVNPQGGQGGSSEKKVRGARNGGFLDALKQEANRK